MVALVPQWANYYEEFWSSINRRNMWFIKLRYGAVVMLSVLLAGTEFVLKLPLTEVQYRAIILITAAILAYNVLFNLSRNNIKSGPDKFNSLHLSLLQIVFDLTALTLLIYYTGGIENPLFMFYIFHMIIGSLILPGFVIYTIAFAVVVLFSSMIFLEYSGYLSHHAVAGLLSQPIYNNLNYLLGFIIVFTLMMFISVVLTNKISRELFKREQQLRETLDKLKQTEAAKEKYVMGIVHEIKSPISAVQTFLDLILGGFTGSVNHDVTEKLQRARNRTDEALNMINNVLHIAKLRLDDKLPMEDVDIALVVDGVICNYKAEAEAKGINLRIDNSLSEQLPLKGDKFLLGIAFSNLVSNAIKYIGYNGIIEVNLKAMDKSLIVEVSDNGIGIPQADLNKVFHEFFRASNIKHKGIEGTGLGLSVVKQIIKNHNGTVEVKSPSRLSEPNKPGTSFIITLPV